MPSIVVASRLNTFADIGQGFSATSPQMSRVRHQCAKPCSSIQVVFTNYQVAGGSFADTDTGNAITVKASLEYPAGTFWPITFSAASSVSIASGAQVVSDVVAGLSIATAGDFLYSRTFLTIVSGHYPTGLVTLSANGEGVETGGTDKTASGTVTPSVAFSYSPAVIIGVPSPSSAAAILTVGDSIGNGSNDTKTPSGFEDAGFLWRAYGSAAKYVYLNSAVSGDTASATVGTNADRRRLPVWAYANFCVCQMGVNDLPNTSLATVQAHLISLWTQISGNGTEVYQTTITPHTTSTDSWATTTNQTPVANFETARTGLNDWLRGGAPMSGGVAVAVGTGGALLAGQNGHPLTGYFEIADQAESARNSGKWRVDLGTPTTDGLHPNPVIHAAMATAIDLTKFVPPSPSGMSGMMMDIATGGAFGFGF